MNNINRKKREEGTAHESFHLFLFFSKRGFMTLESVRINNWTHKLIVYPHKKSTDAILLQRRNLGPKGTGE